MSWRSSGHQHQSIIYFIQEVHGPDMPIKIGRTRNLKSRIEELQIGAPRRMKILAVVPQERASERALHIVFGSSRLRGEWFLPSAELRAYIQSAVDAMHKDSGLASLSAFIDNYNAGLPPLPALPTIVQAGTSSTGAKTASVGTSKRRQSSFQQECREDPGAARDKIRGAYMATGGHAGRAAILLGTNYNTVLSVIRELGIMGELAAIRGDLTSHELRARSDMLMGRGAFKNR